MSRPWSSREDLVLRQVVSQVPAGIALPLGDIGKLLDRSPDELGRRVGALGLEQRPPTALVGRAFPASPRQHMTGKRGAKAGKREDLGGLYLRSSWEANYARYLNLLVERGKIDHWDYEPVCFEFTKIKKGNRYYTPDFRVWAIDGSYVWHEVKGWMDRPSKTKLTRFARYFPDEKLVLIDGPVYRDVATKVSHLIPGWERPPE